MTYNFKKLFKVAPRLERHLETNFFVFVCFHFFSHILFFKNCKSKIKSDYLRFRSTKAAPNTMSSSAGLKLTCKGAKLLPKYNKNPEAVKLYSELGKINLKPVKKIEYKLDPFHPKSLSLRYGLIFVFFCFWLLIPLIHRLLFSPQSRELMFQLSSREKAKTNRDVYFRTEVLSNLEEPKAVITFFNDYKLVFKTTNLSLFDMAFHYNSISRKFIAEME